MPVSFQFKRDGEAVSVAEIDDAIAEFEGKIPDEEKAYFFDRYGWIGIGVLMQEGGSKISSEKLENFLSESDVDFSQLERDCMRKFFVEDYEFHAWR